MWKQAIVRELAVVLVIKLAAIYVIWSAFFSQPDQRELTHREVGQLLLGESRSATPPSSTTSITGVRDGH